MIRDNAVKLKLIYMSWDFKLFGRSIASYSNLEKRSDGSVRLDDPEAWNKLFGETTHTAGINVTPDLALNLTAVYACTNIISRTLGLLPFNLMEKNESGGSSIVRGDRIHFLINRRPNGMIKSYTWRETIIAQALLKGNGYSVINRDQNGYPVSFTLIQYPSNTSIKEVQGELFYKFPELNSNWIHSYDVIHIKAFTAGKNKGIIGRSPISTLNESVSGALVAQRYSNQVFSKGASKKLGIKIPAGKKLDDETEKKMREDWEEKHAGINNLSSVAFLRGGVETTEIGISPEDAQLLGSRRFSIQEIARIYNMPLHKLQELERATNNNIEQMAMEFIDTTLMPWAVELETEINDKVIPFAKWDKQFSRLNLNALLRADSAARAQFYRTLYYLNSLNSNEIRDKEDMSPIEGGERYFVQRNLVPLDKIDDVINNEIKKKDEKQKTAG